jgi:hypothetical protein
MKLYNNANASNVYYFNHINVLLIQTHTLIAFTNLHIIIQQKVKHGLILYLL